MKKLIILGVFVLAIASLSSCRSKKSSCGYSSINTQEKIQEFQQQDDVIVASIDTETTEE